MQGRRCCVQHAIPLRPAATVLTVTDMHIRGFRHVFAAALIGAGLGAASCSATTEPGTAATSPPTASANAQSSLEGHDLRIAQANCRAYEDATESTREFHQKLAEGPVKESIANWVAMYEDGKAGLALEPVPTAPELNQAITQVADAYEDALAKLDHYTMSTDMSNEVVAWDEADAQVVDICGDLAGSG